MRRTRAQLERADVSLRVVDVSAQAELAQYDAREIRVLNKIDLRPELVPSGGEVAMCCLDGRGLEDLVAAVIARTDLSALDRCGEVIAVNERHRHCLAAARDYLGAARQSLQRADPPELTAVELRSALAAIGEITGAVDTEDVLDEIFGSFCIGK
jgi:tRNA modification GTPase